MTDEIYLAWKIGKYKGYEQSAHMGNTEVSRVQQGPESSLTNGSYKKYQDDTNINIQRAEVQEEESSSM